MRGMQTARIPKDNADNEYEIHMIDSADKENANAGVSILGSRSDSSCSERVCQTISRLNSIEALKMFVMVCRSMR